MRQWELIGITDSAPQWTPPRREARLARPETGPGRWTFFWSTDASLRLRSVSDAASEALGVAPGRCEGRELLDVLAFLGPDLTPLEAHAEALAGGVGTFTLRGEMGTVRCRVAPTHGEDDRVIGTFCLATADPPAIEDDPLAALTVAAAA
jgi:PAS domain-containing protein